jgi:2-polyprenyl-6-methoxyphenol hydroxylase-like FAD-dependent oxidoreductase
LQQITREPSHALSKQRTPCGKIHPARFEAFMRVTIVGGGIGGLAAALSLHAVGIECEVYEQVRELRELGVGINILPHAIRELAALGLLPALDRAGVRTRELIYANRFGQVVWRGSDAGFEAPQFSIHRGKLHRVLLAAVEDRLGAGHIHTGCRLVGLDQHHDGTIARFERRDKGEQFEIASDVLVSADGIHSAVRAAFYPDEGPPISNGSMLWRGAADWPVYIDGRTMVIAGGMQAKFVFYPIYSDPVQPRTRLTNWAVLARIGAGVVPPRREDWNRPGQMEELEPLVRDRFRLDFVDPLALIQASGTFYEYPLCDRDPLPRWSFGRTTLLGDAAHPMYPVGSNGASQAVLDARALARHLASGVPVEQALIGFDTERRPMTGEIVLTNRKGGPERVIDLLEERAPGGFDDVEAVASYAEREAIVRGYASMAGFAREQVNTPRRQ